MPGDETKNSEICEISEFSSGCIPISFILQVESPGLCKSSSPIGQRLRYAAAQWMFCSLVDSNTRYDDRPRAVIYNRSVRDTE